MIARIRGYPIKIVMPENVSVERRQPLEVWGAEIILTPGEEGSNGASAGPSRWPTSTPSGRSSTSTPTRPTPGRTTRAPAPRSGATVPRSPTSWPAWAPPARSWASAASSRSRTPTSRSWPSSRRSGERVEGLRNLDEGYIPPVYEKWGGPELLDRKRIVRPRESIEWTRRLVDVGIFSGISGGARWPARPRWPARSTPGTIVVILADGGWKYLSTGAWTGDLDEVAALAEKLIVF